MSLIVLFFLLLVFFRLFVTLPVAILLLFFFFVFVGAARVFLFLFVPVDLFLAQIRLGVRPVNDCIERVAIALL